MFSSYKSLYLFVLHHQTRHQNGDTHFLTLEEILDETKLLDISMKQKQWLVNEVCPVFSGIFLSFIYHQGDFVHHFTRSLNPSRNLPALICKHAAGFS